MPDQNIICPHCSQTIPLSEALSHQIKDQLQAEFKAEQTKQQAALQEQKQKLDQEAQQLATQKESIDKLVSEKLQAEKDTMWQKAQDAAKEKLDTELKDLQNQQTEMSKKLHDSQAIELELRKQKRELEEQQKQQKLEMQRQLDAERQTIAEAAKKEVDETARLKIMEKDKQLDLMKKTIEDLKRKSEQGSTPIQGEIQENDLKQILENNFPMDKIEDVPTGIRGADLVQTINGAMGTSQGIILWESKNTKTWSNDWVKKLKQDQGLVNADLCILISQVLPNHIKAFAYDSGVWVSDYHSILPLVQTLRLHLIELDQVKNSFEGRDEKMAYLYEYLSGSQFKNRIENIVNGWTSMRDELETEKRSLQRLWARREKELDKVMFNTVSFYGDLQGIIGASLPKIQSLELPGPEDNKNDNNDSEETPATGKLL